MKKIISFWLLLLLSACTIQTPSKPVIIKDRNLTPQSLILLDVGQILIYHVEESTPPSRIGNSISSKLTSQLVRDLFKDTTLLPSDNSGDFSYEFEVEFENVYNGKLYYIGLHETSYVLIIIDFLSSNTEKTTTVFTLNENKVDLLKNEINK